MERRTPSADQILQFLLAIPITEDIPRWINEFKNQLCTLLPDVDRVSLHINLDYDISDAAHVQMALIREVEGKDDDETYEMPPDDPEAAIEYFQQQGYRVDHFHEPRVVPFFAANGERFATIYLWREQTAAPISQQTMLLVLALHALAINLFMNVIRCHAAEQSEQRIYVGRLARLVDETEMSEHQNRILIHLLKGRSYQEVAERLGVSAEAVKKTAGRLYKSVGVKSLRELQAKYFGSRFDDGVTM